VFCFRTTENVIVVIIDELTAIRETERQTISSESFLMQLQHLREIMQLTAADYTV